MTRSRIEISRYVHSSIFRRLWNEWVRVHEVFIRSDCGACF